MKKTILPAAIFFLLSYLQVSAQPYGWFTQISGTGNNLNGVYFASNTTGIIAGQSGTILRTTNGGTNWNLIGSGTSVHLFSVTFINGLTGWVAGDVGMILKTTNRGVNWVIQPTGIGYQLRSIDFINANSGFAVGWYGTFLRSTNGGATWSQFSTGIITNLNCVNFVDQNNGFAAGQFGTVIKTTNSGMNWSQIPSGLTAQIEQINYTAVSEVVIIGEGGFIRKTTNLGLNWISQSSGTGNWLYGTSVKNANFYTLVGDYGTVRKTSNGGTNWYSQVSNTGSLLTAVSFVDTNTGWAVGINGTIIKTTTGGWLLPGTANLISPNNGQTCFSMTGTLDWSDVFPPVSNYRMQIASDQNFNSVVRDIWGINESQYTLSASELQYNTLYYWRVKAFNQVGERPNWSGVRNFRTINQIVTAPALNLPADNSTVSVTPLLRWDSIPFAAGYRCRIATDTGFTNLVLDSQNISGRQITVPAGRLNPNTRYYWKVLSSNACITSSYSARWSFITAITGLSEITNEIPLVFALYNNYPNPFNPFTNIKFDIPRASSVKITIYNILGEEAVSVIYSRLEAGKYSYLWNAENYSSGIYVCRFEASSIKGENYGKIIKMVLVK